MVLFQWVTPSEFGYKPKTVQLIRLNTGGLSLYQPDRHAHLALSAGDAIGLAAALTEAAS